MTFIMIAMILLTQSTAVLHNKYLNDELKLLCYNISLRLHRIPPKFSMFREIPAYSRFVATLWHPTGLLVARLTADWPMPDLKITSHPGEPLWHTPLGTAAAASNKLLTACKHMPPCCTLNTCCDVACLTLQLTHITTGSFQSQQRQPTTGSLQSLQRLKERNKPSVRWKGFAIHKLVWWHFQAGWASGLQFVFFWDNINNQNLHSVFCTIEYADCWQF